MTFDFFVAHSLALSARLNRNDTTPQPIAIATSAPRQTHATGFMLSPLPIGSSTHLRVPRESPSLTDSRTSGHCSARYCPRSSASHVPLVCASCRRDQPEIGRAHV